VHVFGGDPVLAHESGCRVVAGEFAVGVRRPAPAAIASCGGAPYDCSFTQTLKTIFHAAPCIADGGALVVLARCPEGIAPGFLRWDRDLSLPELAKTVLARYDLSGHNTYLLRQTLQRIRVALVSALPREQVEGLGLTAAATLEEAWAAARRMIGDASPEYYV